MDGINTKLIKTTCPICGGDVKMTIIDVIDSEKCEMQKAVDAMEDNYVTYKKARWVYHNFSAFVASCNGLPFSFSKEVAEFFTDTVESFTGMDKVEDEIIAYKNELQHMPDIILYEFKCCECRFVLNRYYSRRPQERL